MAERLVRGKLPITLSLGIISAVLAIAVLASLLWPRANMPNA